MFKKMYLKKMWFDLLTMFFILYGISQTKYYNFIILELILLVQFGIKFMLLDMENALDEVTQKMLSVTKYTNIALLVLQVALLYVLNK